MLIQDLMLPTHVMNNLYKGVQMEAIFVSFFFILNSHDYNKSLHGKMNKKLISGSMHLQPC